MAAARECGYRSRLMNWKRGLLRSWIVLTASWVALVAWVAQPSTYFAPQRMSFGFDDKRFEIEFPANTETAVVRRVLTEFVGGERAGRSDGPAAPSADVVVTTALAGYEPRSPWTYLLRLTSVGLLPPLAVLLLGCLAAWVVRGFK